MTVAQSEYMELVAKFPLCEIRSDRELDRAINVIDRLLVRPKLSRDANRYLDALAVLVEHYESSRFGAWEASQAEVLSHLMEAHAVSAADVARATGISPSTISSALKGARQFSPPTIRTIARFFHVDPGVFI